MLPKLLVNALPWYLNSFFFKARKASLASFSFRHLLEGRRKRKEKGESRKSGRMTFSRRERRCWWEKAKREKIYQFSLSSHFLL